MKRTLAMILALVMVLGMLAGCGGAEESAAPESTAPESTAPESEAPQEEPLDWPKKSIEIVVSASAGGDTDANARLIAQYLTEKLGESVIVTNMGGGGGTISTDHVKAAEADGYTLLFTHTMIHGAEALGLVDYGFQAFEPISIVGQGTGELLTVRSDFPADTFEEFVEVVKAHPGEYNYGYSTGGGSHIVGALLQDYGLDINMVSVGNASERVTGLAEGTLTCIMSAYQGIADYIEKGDFKYLGSVADERCENFPDIPTLKEQGLEKCGINTYYTLYAPKGTDPRIIAVLDEAIGDIVNNNTEYQEGIFTAYGQSPFYMNSEDATARLTEYREVCMSMSELMQNAG